MVVNERVLEVKYKEGEKEACGKIKGGEANPLSSPFEVEEGSGKADE